MKSLVLAMVVLGCGKQELQAPPAQDAETSSTVDAAMDSVESIDTETAVDTEPTSALPDCPSGPFYIRVTEPAGILDEFTHNCIPHSAYVGNDIPLAFQDHKGGNTTTHFAACEAHDSASRRVSMLLDSTARPSERWVGIDFKDGRYFSTAPGGTFVIDRTRNEPIGGVVEGTFEGDVVHEGVGPDGGAAAHITGSFRLCHGTDGYVEP